MTRKRLLVKEYGGAFDTHHGISHADDMPHHHAVCGSVLHKKWKARFEHKKKLWRRFSQTIIPRLKQTQAYSFLGRFQWNPLQAFESAKNTCELAKGWEEETQTHPARYLALLPQQLGGRRLQYTQAP
jgi:hypothetical protein